MYQAIVGNNFKSWREVARGLLGARIGPDQVIWTDELNAGLFSQNLPAAAASKNINVPREFLALAAAVACHDSVEKWALLYRLLYRLTYVNRRLLEIESDPDVRGARLMEKAVKRDIHKFHAFVRFRRVEADGREIFVAWHEPRHFTVEPATPFFARRFGAMYFSILTPKGCAHWDLMELTFSPGVARDLAPESDETEDFWLTYYRSIFNPFRLKIKAMKKEFPVRHWRTLPEAVLIPELIRSAK
jgi:uracil-DNA glycosylase